MLKKTILLICIMMCTSCDDFWFLADQYYIFIRFTNTSEWSNVYCIIDKDVSDGCITAGSKIDLSRDRDSQIFLVNGRKPFFRRKEWEEVITFPVAIYVINIDLLMKEDSSDKYIFGREKNLTDSDIAKIPTESILVEYHISPSEFKKLNWSFSFPPDLDMKDIDMIPPYHSFR